MMPLAGATRKRDNARVWRICLQFLKIGSMLEFILKLSSLTINAHDTEEQTRPYGGTLKALPTFGKVRYFLNRVQWVQVRGAAWSIPRTNPPLAKVWGTRKSRELARGASLFSVPFYPDPGCCLIQLPLLDDSNVNSIDPLDLPSSIIVISS